MTRQESTRREPSDEFSKILHQQILNHKISTDDVADTIARQLAKFGATDLKIRHTPTPDNQYIVELNFNVPAVIYEQYKDVLEQYLVK